MSKIKWGVISTAKIAVEKVIPAMQQGELSAVIAIGSRSLTKAKSVAKALNIANYYGSYEDLLADPGVEAVYNPLPNHLHVPLSVKALQAGKHVLCEKPIALSSQQAQSLVDESKKYPHLKVMEAFMYRFHPQWIRAKELCQRGRIGSVKTIETLFSYYNDDPQNVRNMADIGGGGLMDIGCYGISLARFILEREPDKVCGYMDIDARFRVDRLARALLDFGEGQTSSFVCATQLAPYQRVNIFGSKGRIEISVPFNPLPNEPAGIRVQDDQGLEELLFDPCDQYTIQGDLFSRAILTNSKVPTPIEDSVANMKVIEAIIRSVESGTWQKIV